jgi:hypothetical protein
MLSRMLWKSSAPMWARDVKDRRIPAHGLSSLCWGLVYGGLVVLLCWGLFLRMLLFHR